MSNQELCAAIERIVRPIVEGQIRGFLKEHPPIVEAVDWYKPRKHDKATTFTNSLAKRIVRDLACGSTTARLAAAILEFGPETRRHLDRGTSTCGDSGPLATVSERAALRAQIEEGIYRPDHSEITELARAA